MLWIFDSITILSLRTIWKINSKWFSPRISYKYGFVFTADIGDAILFSIFYLIFTKKVEKSCLIITSDFNKKLIQSFFPSSSIIALSYSSYKFNLFYRFLKIRELVSVNLCNCIVPMRSRDYFISDSLSRVVGRNNLLTFRSDESNRVYLESLLERFIYKERIEDFSSDAHELEAYEILMNKFQVNFHKELTHELPIFRELINRNIVPILEIPSKYLVMNIGASQRYKRWPVEKFIAVAKTIYDDFGLISVFVGGPSEKDLSGTFNDHYFIIDYISKTEDVNKLRGLLMNAEVILSNDSFVGHYAVMLGVSVISIVGGGHFGRFLPFPKQKYSVFSNSHTIFKKIECYNCLWRCTRFTGNNLTSYPCVGEITINEVILELKKALSHKCLGNNLSYV